MKEDFSKHIMINWNWIREYRSSMGEKEFNDYFGKIYLFLLQLPEGKYFDISQNVTEKNRDIFIKICCLFIIEQRKSKNDYYVFNENYNLFIHKNHV